MRKLFVAILLVSLIGTGNAIWAGPITDTIKQEFVKALPWMQKLAFDKIQALIKGGGIKDLPSYEQVILTGLAAVANAPFDSGHYAALKEAAIKAKGLCGNKPLTAKLLDESVKSADSLNNFENGTKALAAGIGYAATTDDTSPTKSYLKLGITMYAAVNSNKVGYDLFSHSWKMAMGEAKTENPSWLRALTFGQKSADNIKFFEDSCKIMHTVANAVLETQPTSMFLFCLESISAIRFQALDDLVKVLSSGLTEYAGAVDSATHKQLSTYVVKVAGMMKIPGLSSTFLVKSIGALRQVLGNEAYHKALFKLAVDLSATVPADEAQAADIYRIVRTACLEGGASAGTPEAAKAELKNGMKKEDAGDGMKTFKGAIPILRNALAAALSKS